MTKKCVSQANKKIVSRVKRIINTCTLRDALWRWHWSQYNWKDALRQLIVDLKLVDLCVQLYLMHWGTILQPKTSLKCASHISTMRSQHLHIQIIHLETKIID